MEKYFFSSSPCKVLLPDNSLKVLLKNTLSGGHIVLTENQNQFISKAVLPYQTAKQKHFHRNTCSKVFTRFQINVSSGNLLQKSCKNQVSSFSKDKRRVVVPLETLKVFRTATLWASTANYFHFYVILLFHYYGFFISHKSF